MAVLFNSGGWIIAFIWHRVNFGGLKNGRSDFYSRKNTPFVFSWTHMRWLDAGCTYMRIIRLSLLCIMSQVMFLSLREPKSSSFKIQWNPRNSTLYNSGWHPNHGRRPENEMPTESFIATENADWKLFCDNVISEAILYLRLLFVEETLPRT